MKESKKTRVTDLEWGRGDPMDGVREDNTERDELLWSKLLCRRCDGTNWRTYLSFEWVRMRGKRIIHVFERRRQWPVTGYWCLTSRKWIVSWNKKKRIAFKILTAVPRMENYKIGAAVQILETIGYISSRNDSFTRGHSKMWRFTRGQPQISVTGHWRILSHMYVLGDKLCLRKTFFHRTMTICHA